MPRSSTAPITWRAVQQMPDDGNRYEAIAGELHVTAAPTTRHARVSKRLQFALDRLLERPGRGEIFVAPFGVEFPTTGEGVQPDLLFVANERREIIGEDWIRGAPDLMVEIVSPTTEDRDRGIKRRLYERHGVPEYWIVDPEANFVDVWRFGGDPEHERLTETLPVRLGSERHGTIDLRDIFRPDF